MEQNALTPILIQDHFRHLLAEFGETLFKDVHDLRENPIALYLSGQNIYGRRAAVKAGRLLAQHLPHALLYEFEGRGHIPMVTATGEFCEALRQFIHTGTVPKEP